MCTAVQDVLPDAERELAAHLDKNLGGGGGARGGSKRGGRVSGHAVGARGGWPLARALSLASVARRCIAPLVSKRCVVADVTAELDALAGRQPPSPPSSSSVAGGAHGGVGRSSSLPPWEAAAGAAGTAGASSSRDVFGSAQSAELRKGSARALVGRRVRVFDAAGGAAGREGSVVDLKSTLGGSTKHVIIFEGGGGSGGTLNPPKLESVLLQKTEGAAKGTRFHLLA